MLGGAWLLITLAVLLVAIILRLVPLLLIALLFFLAAAVARLWARYSLDRVEYTRKLSEGRAFFGDTVTLEVSLANRKILPMPWLQVDDEVPEGVHFERGKLGLSNKPTRVILSNFVSLGWYHRITRRYPVHCNRRGYFAFGPATIRSGDLFGFFRRDALSPRLDTLIVYPKIVPLEQLGIPSRDPFGDIRVRQHLFEDPARVVSTRDYVPGDPMKRVHWKATARVQRLQTRVFERTTTVDLALFFDGRTVAPPLMGRSEQRLETAAIAAASIANDAVDRGYRVGLYSNEMYRGTDRMIRIPPADHPDQLLRILEALAQVQGLPARSIDQVIVREGRSLPWAATMAIVSAAPSSSTVASLTRFRRAGRRAVLILIGEGEGFGGAAGLPVFRVSDEMPWRDQESVDLVASGTHAA